jgi:hypothetical protein
MTMQLLKLEGRDYVVVPKSDWDRITSGRIASDELPPLPELDVDGSVDAIAEMAAVPWAGLGRPCGAGEAGWGWVAMAGPSVRFCAPSRR